MFDPEVGKVQLPPLWPKVVEIEIEVGIKQVILELKGFPVCPPVLRVRAISVSVTEIVKSSRILYRRTIALKLTSE